jgi:hypothetical protein
MHAADVLQRLRDRGYKTRGNRAQCPAHDGDGLNLEVKDGDEAVICTCYSHRCPFVEIVRALELCMDDMWFDPASRNGQDDGCIEHIAAYRDEQGVVQYEIHRFDYPNSSREKEFKATHDGKPGMGGRKPILLDLPGLLKLVREDPTAVYGIAEGELKAARVTRLGIVCTTAPFGAGKWRPEYAGWLKEYLPHARPLILPDNDLPGKKHALMAGESLQALGIQPYFARLDGLAEGEDVVQWIARGGTKEQLLSMASPAICSFNSICSYKGEPVIQPLKLADEAYHGLVGEITQTIMPHTESDPALVLTHSIAGIGNLVGRKPHMMIDGARHAMNFYFLHVGATAKGRKGTGGARAQQPLAAVDELWAKRIRRGLSTGEGLIAYLQDEEGGTGRCAFIIEPEFAAVLKVMERQGNTLAPVLRQAWDGTTLATMTRKDPLEAVNPHVSIVGHISADELRARLTETDMASGTMNRFMVISVKRSKYLPRGGGDAHVAPLTLKLKAAVDRARKIERVTFSEEAGLVWDRLYKPQDDGRPGLADGQPGLFGAMVGRAEAQVVRLSMFYTVMDGKTSIMDGKAEIALPHLYAALAVWDYAEASTSQVFGSVMGDWRADRILTALAQAGEGGYLTGRGLFELFGRNPEGVTEAQQLLLRHGRVRCEKAPTGEPGRPEQRWRLNPVKEPVDHTWLGLAKEIRGCL